MNRDINRFNGKEYDLLVVGGGINGAAIANIASGRGLKVALLEKHDFASGTSSKSTKLVHGGIRYLENLEFDLVHESLKERYIQLKSVPHLVKPLQFIIPVYKGDNRPLWMMQLGVFLYDCLAGKYSIGRHKNLSVNKLTELEPNLVKTGMTGGVMYFDGQMDDARLCLENVLSAAQKGADVANYTEVTSFIKSNDRAVGVKVTDILQQHNFEVYAKKIVCTVGPWGNFILRMDDPNAKKRLRTTKGIHIVYKGQVSNNALLIPSSSDKRVFFIIPWRGHSLIGTTDTDFINSPDDATATEEDIDYLFHEARRVFPSVEFSKEKIITTFAGLRPLIRRGGNAPSKVSRKHDIFKTPSGISFVIGGKYTTYRKIAQDCVDTLTRTKHAKDEAEFPLYGSGLIVEKIEDIAREFSVSIEIVQTLISTYGARYKDVLMLTRENPQLKERFCTCNPFIKAQIVYALKTEMAQTAEDIIARRLSIGYLPCETKDCERAISQIIFELLKTQT